MGRQAGLTEAHERGLAGDASALTELERDVLRYAEALSATPVGPTEELLRALRRQLDDEQLVELTSAIAWENYRARFNRAFRVPSEDYAGAEASSPPLKVPRTS
ncbi:MAG TPA: hypothetical protein VM509_11470 [Planctomycetota bacterium]|nr:hypothetical protein [Planctomycetota bacterium]